MPGKTKKIHRRTSLGKYNKHKKTMKRRVKKSRRNRSNKYKKGMMGRVNTPPSTPPRRFNIVQLPPPQTPPGGQPVGQSDISPTVKNKKEDENEYVPIALFPQTD